MQIKTHSTPTKERVTPVLLGDFGSWMMEKFFCWESPPLGGADRNFTCSLVVGRRAESSSLCGRRG